MSDSGKRAPRIAAIDQFRGLATLVMVLGNNLMASGRAPSWLLHARDPGLTTADLFAPLFIFAMGLTYGPSMRRRTAKDGAARAFGHAALRWAILVGIGSVITLVETFLGANPSGVYWGVLEAIGAAGLIALPFILLPAWARLCAGLAILGLYQVLLENIWLETVKRSPHGGILGSLGWGGLLILSTAVGELFLDEKRRRWLFPLGSLAFLGAGLLLDPLVALSKVRVSPSYVLLSVGVSGLAFLLVWVLTEKVGSPSRLLEAWGKNPLLLYVLHICLLAVFLVPAVTDYLAAVPFIVVATQDLCMAGLLSVLALWMDSRNFVLSL